MAISVLLRSLIVNVFLSILKIVVGYLVFSNALVADGIHSLSDFLTDIISIGGLKLANKKEDKEHPYGHGQIEYLLCIITGIIIIVLSISLLINAFISKNTIPSFIVAIVTLFTIFIKYILSRYLLNKGKKSKSSILIASGYESMSDVRSSFVVLLACFIGPIFPYADKVACVIISLLIFRTGINVLKENVSNIIGGKETDEEIIAYVNNIILKNKEVLKMDNCKLLKYGSYYKCEVTIYLDGKETVAKSNKLVERLKSEIMTSYDKIKYVDIYVKAMRKK